MTSRSVTFCMLMLVKKIHHIFLISRDVEFEFGTIIIQASGLFKI